MIKAPITLRPLNLTLTEIEHPLTLFLIFKEILGGEWAVVLAVTEQHM